MQHHSTTRLRNRGAAPLKRPLPWWAGEQHLPARWCRPRPPQSMRRDASRVASCYWPWWAWAPRRERRGARFFFGIQ